MRFFSVVVLCASCGVASVEMPDAGSISEISDDGGAPAEPDAGVDAGLDDAGSTQPFDAGPADAGADAGYPTGTWQNPELIAGLPAVVGATTAGSDYAVANTYSCAATDERGPEHVYTLTPEVSGVLTLRLDDVPGDAVDLDVQLLSAAAPSACFARGNITVSAHVDAGTQLWVSVDTFFDGLVAKAGAYTLTLDLIADTAPGNCPADMLPVAGICMDKYEAPNVASALPLVMVSFDEADAWCGARNKRLCFEDEWTQACEGVAQTKYPYGDVRQPGVCHDDQVWKQYNQTLLNGWPSGLAVSSITHLADLLAEARTHGAAAIAAADHVEALYQGIGSGSKLGCTNETGVMDLTGSVEEWTRRRAPSGATFNGNLKGRYWADTRTCQNNITNHGDFFHFYEIGFRCCKDP